MSMAAALEQSSSSINDLHQIQNCLCPSCSGFKANTSILPTSLFRQKNIIVSVQCPDCHFRDVHVESGSVQPKGRTISLEVTSEEDWNRQIFKSDTATVLLPAVDLELPPGTQAGVNTLEGLVTKAADNLEKSQGERLRGGDLDNFYRCLGVISELRRVLGTCDRGRDGSSIDGDDHDEKRTNGELASFTMVLDDPAGNSFLENTRAPHPDPNTTIATYDRTPTQDMELGFQPSQGGTHSERAGDSDSSHENIEQGSSPQNHSIDIEEEGSNLFPASGGLIMSQLREEAIKFPTRCPHCRASAETSMCVTNIPHFKEVIIMCLLCEQCGYRSNEIKGGGAIPPLGTKITLRVTSWRDLAREVLKSDTAGISVPELDLELECGGLNGVYTTVEGLLRKMHDRLWDANPFGMGDSSIKQYSGKDGEGSSLPTQQHLKFRKFLIQLKGMADGERFPFTLILSDPLSNSFVGPVLNVAETLTLQTEEYETLNDRGLKVEEFERSEVQNEYLGLNDMKIHNY